MDIENQGIDVPGIPGAKRSAFSEKLCETYDGITTAYEAYLKGAEKSGDKPCLGKQFNGSYTWMTYNQVLERAADLGSGILELGYQPSAETFLGIYAANGVEWILTDVACLTYSLVSVPLYDTLGSDACTFIINHSDISLIVCDENKVEVLLAKAEECPKLKHIITIGDVKEEVEQKAGKRGIMVKSFKNILELGRSNRQEKSPGKPDDIFTVCYTSGTTGQPKGAMITNRNVATVIAANRIHFERNGRPLVPNDLHISYLPLPHIYERIVQLIFRSSGSRSGFSRGDIQLLFEDLRLLRPTVFPSVPRLLNRLYDMVTASIEASSGIKKSLFNKAFASKLADLERGNFYSNSFWDKVVFRKIQAILGGNVSVIITGAAPIEAKVLNFFKVVFGCWVIEGYGLTEGAGSAAMTNMMDKSSGHVGPPVATSYIKLVDIPEMEYYTFKNQGEVCIYGTNVFKGYLKEPKKTAEVIDKDGWLHSGDVGEWKPNGTLKIIGRKKCIFKLSQGEYVAPDKIENVYIKSPFVAQVFVHGYSLKSFIVGIVVPDEAAMIKWASENGLSKTFQELCEDEDVKNMILEDIVARGKEAKLASFEQVKNILLHSELFSVENGLLTPTLKSKRFTLQKRFADEIEKLYKNQEQTARSKL
ncbi:long-chain-fatty-acid--CoA ligase 5-like isoform X1 [Dendronephthya gigantea]|uniref:long-chain-fatty-acid--CoA ligase 5-like isoform X1 n=2 Tax=Dendronephthya gigantea TaxID=151771 RepID=UPI00106D22BC|nr:long-chain-fatty-acid--CoA ligase 5-like isoform X1 [Dendronephthya gigantea]